MAKKRKECRKKKKKNDAVKCCTIALSLRERLSCWCWGKKRGREKRGIEKLGNAAEARERRGLTAPFISADRKRCFCGERNFRPSISLCLHPIPWQSYIRDDIPYEFATARGITTARIKIRTLFPGLFVDDRSTIILYITYIYIYTYLYRYIYREWKGNKKKKKRRNSKNDFHIQFSFAPQKNIDGVTSKGCRSMHLW